MQYPLNPDKEDESDYKKKKAFQFLSSAMPQHEQSQ